MHHAVRVTNRPSRRNFLTVTGGVAAALPLSMLTGCASERDASTLRIAFQQFGSDTNLQRWLTGVAEAFTAKHAGVSVELVPIVAATNDYFTKNELLMASPRSCPDVVFEDSFILQSDIAAGYLQPIDDLVDAWEAWESFYPASKEAAKDPEGRVHFIPTETDTRGIYYHKRVFEKAGLPTEWQPSTWDDIAETAAVIRDADIGATGMFMYCGKAQGESASMQGLEMLLYGTNDTLYNPETKKWVARSQGFIDALAFYKRQFDEGLTLPAARHFDPNLMDAVQATMFPAGELGILIDGSWISFLWAEGSLAPWPTWPDDVGVAFMPTQHGEAPGSTTLAGGWGWAIPTHARDRELSFALVKELCSLEHQVQRNITGGTLTTRRDVAQNEEYRGYSPTVGFFTDMLEGAHYRPAFAVYPEVSSAIQDAMDTVMVGDKTPEQAAAWYDAKLAELVGDANVETRKA